VRRALLPVSLWHWRAWSTPYVLVSCDGRGWMVEAGAGPWTLYVFLERMRASRRFYEGSRERMR
jgi:hypothetical protein